MAGDWPQVPGETPIDPSDLKVRGITTRADLNAAEANNIRRPIVKYLAGKPSRRIAPFDLAWSLRLHAEMFGDVWNWAGQVRNRELNLGVASYAILGELQLLLDDLRSWSGFGMDLVEQSARLHYRAVHIHPFMNGNGRWSRLLASIWLKQRGHSPVRWPEDVIGTESPIRAEYIAAVQAADTGDYEPLIELHRRYLEPRNA
jgi:Fic-DOC domain mobile mystery protein B